MDLITKYKNYLKVNLHFSEPPSKFSFYSIYLFCVLEDSPNHSAEYCSNVESKLDMLGEKWWF